MKISFWKYLVRNTWIYAGFLLFIGGFITYWVVTAEDDVTQEVTWSLIVSGGIGLILIIGSYINWRKL